MILSKLFLITCVRWGWWRIKLNGTLHTVLSSAYIKSAKAFFRFLKYNLIFDFIFIIDVHLIFPWIWIFIAKPNFCMESFKKE